MWGVEPKEFWEYDLLWVRAYLCMTKGGRAR
jgi:hypothetical protein